MPGYERISPEEMDGEIFYNFPVEIRKPRSLRKTPGDRLHFAVWRSEEDQVRDLIVHKGVPVDSSNSLGQTPLFVAACMSKSDIVTQLLHLGANPNARCRGGHTPVHAACFSGSRRILSNILKFGGDLTIHDSNRKIPADWIDFQSDERRRHRAHTVLESFRLNEIRNLKLIENNQNVPYSNYDDESVQYLESQVGQVRLSKKSSSCRSFEFPTRVLSKEEKYEAESLTDRFLQRYEESGGRPILSYELNADKDLSDSDALSLLDYQSDGSSQNEDYTLGGSLHFAGLDEPDHMSKPHDEKLKRSCSLREGTSEVRDRQFFGISGRSGGFKEATFQRASVSSLPTGGSCKPATNEKNLKFFLSKKDDFEFESAKDVETAKNTQAKGSNLRVQVADRGQLNTLKKADDVSRATLPFKLRFNTTIPITPRAPNVDVAPKNSSVVTTGGKITRPTPLKQIISANNAPGLQGILGRRIRSNPVENHLPPATSNQPVQSKIVSQSVKQSPPSGLVFSAERYAAHKQTSTTGPTFSTEQREVKVLKNAPLVSSTEPEKQNKALFTKVNPQTGRNIASDIEFRVILENMKRRSTGPHARKQKTTLEPIFPDVVCGARRSEPRPTIKPASHFTESHGQVLRPILQEEGARACPKKVVVMDNAVQVPSKGSKVKSQYLDTQSKSNDFNFGATRAIFESSKVDLPNFAPLINGPRMFRSRIDPKSNLLKPVARKMAPQPPPKPNLVYKESMPPFDPDLEYPPPAFQTSTPRRPSSVEQKGNLYAPVTGLIFSRVTTRPTKSFKPYNSNPAEVTYNDLGSSIDYHTANSTSVIGEDFDISAVPTPQPSPLPLFKVPYEARRENQLVSKGPLKSSLMSRNKRVDPAPVVDISDSLAIGGEVHFDTILERTMMLERSAKIRQTLDQTGTTNQWLTFDAQDQNIENNNNSEGDGPDDSEEGSWSFPQPPLNEEIEALENGQLPDYSWSQDHVPEGDDRRNDDYSPYTAEGFCEEQNNYGDDERAELDDGQTWDNDEPEVENECYEENQNGENQEVNDDAIPNSWGEDANQFDEEPHNESRIDDCHGDGIQEQDEVQNDDNVGGDNNPEPEDDQSHKCELTLDPKDSHWKTLDVDSDCPPINDGSSSKNPQNPTDDQYFDDHLEEDCMNEPHLNLLGDASFGFDGSTSWN